MMIMSFWHSKMETGDDWWDVMGITPASYTWSQYMYFWDCLFSFNLIKWKQRKFIVTIPKLRIMVQVDNNERICSLFWWTWHLNQQRAVQLACSTASLSASLGWWFATLNHKRTNLCEAGSHADVVVTITIHNTLPHRLGVLHPLNEIPSQNTWFSNKRPHIPI